MLSNAAAVMFLLKVYRFSDTITIAFNRTNMLDITFFYTHSLTKILIKLDTSVNLLILK